MPRRMSLPRTYMHKGKHYGPGGNVEVPDTFPSAKKLAEMAGQRTAVQDLQPAYVSAEAADMQYFSGERRTEEPRELDMVGDLVEHPNQTSEPDTFDTYKIPTDVQEALQHAGFESPEAVRSATAKQMEDAGIKATWIKSVRKAVGAQDPQE
jgi:hypothetical protein